MNDMENAENKYRAHLTGMLKDLAELGVKLPPGEYTVEDLIRKIALAKARKAAIQGGPTERLRGQ